MTATERLLDRASRRASQTVKRIGEELRAARRDRDLSQRAVGRAAGVSASTVSRIERGLTADISVRRLTELAEIVGLDLSVRAFRVASRSATPASGGCSVGSSRRPIPP